MIGEFYGKICCRIAYINCFFVIAIYPSNKKNFLIFTFYKYCKLQHTGREVFYECDPYCIVGSDQINNIELGVDNKY